MGNYTTLLNTPQCTGIIGNNDTLYSQIELVGSSNHPYLGRIQVWKIMRNNEQLFSKVRYGSDQSHKEAMMRAHQHRCQLSNSGLFNYYGCTFFEKYELLANIIEQRSFYEYPKVNLVKVIENHRQHLNSVRETKVLQILYDVASTLGFLRDNDRYHGDLNTQSILLDNKTQRAKIFEHGEVAGLLTGYARILLEKQQAFLSPQLMRGLQLKSVCPENDWIKSDIYSLGMVLLELMTQESILYQISLGSYSCYDFVTMEIDSKLVTKRLSQAESIGYSEQLLELVKSMLINDEISRISIDALIGKTNDMIQKNAKERQLKEPRSSVPIEPQASLQSSDSNKHVTPIRMKLITTVPHTAPQFQQYRFQPLVTMPPRVPQQALVHKSMQQHPYYVLKPAQQIPLQEQIRTSFEQHPQNVQYQQSQNIRTRSLERVSQQTLPQQPQRIYLQPRDTFIQPTITLGDVNPFSQQQVSQAQLRPSDVKQFNPQNSSPRKFVGQQQFATPSTEFGKSQNYPTPSPPEIKRNDLNRQPLEQGYSTGEAHLQRLAELNQRVDGVMNNSKEAIQRYGGLQI